MATTFELISSVTVGAGGAASISFTSIPSTYTDLNLVISGRSTTSGPDLQMTFNGVTSSVYQWRRVYGTGSSTGSDTATQSSMYLGSGINGSATTANTFGNVDVYIPNYANSTTYKSVSVDAVMEDNATAAYNTLLAGLFQNTSAISSLTVSPYSANFVQYSTAYLYGVKNA